MAGSVALKQAPHWLKDMYAQHFIHESRSFVELLQYCQINTIPDDRLIGCVERLARVSSCPILVAHVLALLGNQPEQECVTLPASDPIALASMENLQELTAMMNFN